MGFRFHDSLTKSIRDLVTVEPGVVRMYNCGPTVYSSPQIGNWRANVCWDVLRRALELGGYRVRQIMNITDVGHLTVDDVADAEGEDKLEAASRKLQLNAWDVAKKYTAEFMEGRKKLNLVDAEIYPRATDHIAEMIAHTEALVRGGHAYVTPAGNVYFRVKSFPAYGRLSGNTVEELDAGSRVEVLSEKEDPADFALWKRDDKHQMQWDSPWGRGFPGWHIECSAMARKYLGDTLDIHTGGEDNAFPHHECEIAQSEALTGKPFSGLWLHCRHLLVDGAKMSKSKGTAYTLADVEARGFSPRVLRYFLLSAHYRMPMNFTWEALSAAKGAVESLDAMVRGIVEDASLADRPEVAAACDDAGTKFLAALEDDLNASAALAVVHEFRGFANRSGPYSAGDAARVRARIESLDRVLGLELPARSAVVIRGLGASVRLSAHPGFVIIGEKHPDRDAIDALVAERQAARTAKDFKRSDVLREQLKAMGIVLEDTPQGPKWHRAT